MRQSDTPRNLRGRPIRVDLLVRDRHLPTTPAKRAAWKSAAFDASVRFFGRLKSSCLMAMVLVSGAGSLILRQGVQAVASASTASDWRHSSTPLRHLALVDKPAQVLVGFGGDDLGGVSIGLLGVPPNERGQRSRHELGQQFVIAMRGVLEMVGPA